LILIQLLILGLKKISLKSKSINSFPPSFNHGETTLEFENPLAKAADFHFSVLVLGSIPGEKSLVENKYYAHPRNSFWWIMSQLFGFSIDTSYEERLFKLHSSGVLLWDVLYSCERKGSLDSSIKNSTEQANDIAGLLSLYPSIRTIVFNGAKAEQCFKKYIEVLELSSKLRLYKMPSTSPAHASMSRETKLEYWQRCLMSDCNS